MDAGFARRARHQRVAVIGQARHHRQHRVREQIGAQRGGIGGIEPHRLDIRQAMGARDAGRRGLIDIGQLHLVGPGFGQQA